MEYKSYHIVHYIYIHQNTFTDAEEIMLKWMCDMKWCTNVDLFVRLCPIMSLILIIDTNQPQQRYAVVLAEAAWAVCVCVCVSFLLRCYAEGSRYCFIFIIALLTAKSPLLVALLYAAVCLSWKCTFMQSMYVKNGFCFFSCLLICHYVARAHLSFGYDVRQRWLTIGLTMYCCLKCCNELHAVLQLLFVKQSCILL